MTVKGALGAMVCLATALIPTGCGSAPGPRQHATTTHRLSAQATYRVAVAEAAVARYCADSLRTSVTDRETDRYIRALDQLVVAYRRDPAAVYQVGRDSPRTLRQVLGDRASALQGCGLGVDADRLDRVLRDG